MALSHVDEEHRDFIKSMVMLCLLFGLQPSKKSIQLWPTTMGQLDAKHRSQWGGKVQTMLEDPAYEAYFQMVPGRIDVAVLPKLSALFPVCSTALASLLSRVKAVEQHPDTRYR